MCLSLSGMCLCFPSGFPPTWKVDWIQEIEFTTLVPEVIPGFQEIQEFHEFPEPQKIHKFKESQEIQEFEDAQWSDALGQEIGTFYPVENFATVSFSSF